MLPPNMLPPGELHLPSVRDGIDGPLPRCRDPRDLQTYYLLYCVLVCPAVRLCACARLSSVQNVATPKVYSLLNAN